MMRKAFLSSVLLLLMVSAALAGGDVKVLILDEGFTRVPDKTEKLAKLDDVNGTLYIGQTSYTGNIEVWKSSEGLYLINELPLEEYVEGVVKAETGKDWALEALKAQAVIVRTYVLQQKQQNSGKQFHVTSSVLHQVYRGKNSNTTIAEAVRSTRSEILAYEGAPIVAYYHSTSCGHTEAPEEVFGKNYPYLKPVESSGRLSPFSMWSRTIPIRRLEEATGVEDIRDVRVKSRTSTGRVKEIALFSPSEGPAESMSNTTVEAKDLRRMLGWRDLPSTDFDLRVEGDTVVVEGKGYGHGVGLCQWTALEMAMEGKNYKEILSHFYPGASLVSYEDLGL